jgi:hypothetical protein
LGEEFPARLKLVASDTESLKFPGVMPAPANATEALALTEQPGATPLALGLAAGKLSPLPARLGVVEASEARSGRVVWTAELTADGTSLVAWQPFELMGRVASDGLVGGLAVTRSSGSDEVDKIFRERFARDERVGQRLPPGLYLFRIAP